MEKFLEKAEEMHSYEEIRSKVNFSAGFEAFVISIEAAFGNDFEDVEEEVGNLAIMKSRIPIINDENDLYLAEIYFKYIISLHKEPFPGFYLVSRLFMEYEMCNSDPIGKKKEIFQVKLHAFLHTFGRDSERNDYLNRTPIEDMWLFNESGRAHRRGKLNFYLENMFEIADIAGERIVMGTEFFDEKEIDDCKHALNEIRSVFSTRKRLTYDKGLKFDKLMSQIESSKNTLMQSMMDELTEEEMENFAMCLIQDVIESWRRQQKKEAERAKRTRTKWTKISDRSYIAAFADDIYLQSYPRLYKAFVELLKKKNKYEESRDQIKVEQRVATAKVRKTMKELYYSRPKPQVPGSLLPPKISSE